MAITLERDLTDCRGRLLARRGEEISPAAVRRAAAATRPRPPRLLAHTVVAEDVREPFGDPANKHLFRRHDVREQVQQALLSAALPEGFQEELEALRDRDWGRYRHGIATAAVTARLLLAAVGQAKALPDLAAAALLHDLGMTHLSAQMAGSGNQLGPSEALEIAAHPLLGAFHLAALLGLHPAVDAALGHHWRRGTGYPRLSGPPPRSVEVIAVASSYAAMTQPRHYRSTAFDARGAADVLVAEAQRGEVDLEAVQLLVHVLRGEGGDRHRMRFGKQRLGHEPAENHHTLVARALAPALA